MSKAGIKKTPQKNMKTRQTRPYLKQAFFFSFWALSVFPNRVTPIRFHTTTMVPAVRGGNVNRKKGDVLILRQIFNRFKGAEASDNSGRIRLKNFHQAS